MDITEPELDQSGTYLAISELQLFMEYFPLSELRSEAQDMIMKMHDLLVEKDYLSAKLYYNLGDFMAYRGNNYLACIITAQNALKDYPYTARREELSSSVEKAFHVFVGIENGLSVFAGITNANLFLVGNTRQNRTGTNRLQARKRGDCALFG